MKLINKLWIAIGGLIVLSPLGLLLPEYLKAGRAWGEWDRFPVLWHAPLPDYAFQGWKEKGLGHLSFAYIVSAAIGIFVTVCVMLLIAKLLIKKSNL